MGKLNDEQLKQYEELQYTYYSSDNADVCYYSVVIGKLFEHIDALNDELEAAINDLHYTSGCNSCFHSHKKGVTPINFVGQEVCKDCMKNSKKRNNWKWRGIKD